MTQQELEQSWQLTRFYLAKARNLLPADVTENWGGKSGAERSYLYWYEEFLDHNELELALNQLEDLGGINDCPKEYWRMLKKAASNMGLRDRLDYYEGKITDSPR